MTLSSVPWLWLPLALWIPLVAFVVAVPVWLFSRVFGSDARDRRDEKRAGEETRGRRTGTAGRVVLALAALGIVAAFGCFLAFPFHAFASQYGAEDFQLRARVDCSSAVASWTDRGDKASVALASRVWGKELDIEPAPSHADPSTDYYEEARVLLGAPKDVQERGSEAARRIACGNKARVKLRNFGMVAGLVVVAAALVLLALWRPRAKLANAPSG